MLRQLSIRHFVLIDRLDLEFGSGLTVLTGETGAGKSIVLDALGLALGARAEAGMVRPGERQADIRAEFVLESDDPAWAAFEARGLVARGDSIVLRRIVEAGGRSRAQLNGQPIAVSELRELSELLLELHAQHEHQALVQPRTQRELLDRAGSLGALAMRVREAHAAWREAVEALEAARREGEAIERARERLQTELDALRALAPRASEWEALNLEQRRLAHAREILSAMNEVERALAEEEGLIDRLAALANRMGAVERFDARLAEARSYLEAARAEATEAAQWLRREAARVDLDPQRLAEVEARVSAYFDLARRLRSRPEALEIEWQRREVEWQRLCEAQDIPGLEARAEAARQALETVAEALSRARREAAARLSEAVTRDLPALALPEAEFSIAFEPEPAPTAHGSERVEFCFRSHPTLPLAPLARVASGGERARLALAILVAAGQAAAGPALVFDEADVGVGGQVAAQVGRRLQQLASARQVLAVTHMPQVAAHADHHLLVEREEGSLPVTRVRVLGAAEREREIARMLSGHAGVSEATRRLAQELLREAARPASP
ncbi:MAG: DNA repair protein RecN [Casimicrobiaceae bacterium]|nr:DNA repair protein RecN [Casimicrobiaceae bacterium]